MSVNSIVKFKFSDYQNSQSQAVQDLEQAFEWDVTYLSPPNN